MGVNVAGLVLLDACGFDLLEAPLGQVDISGTEVAAQHWMAQPEACGERPNPGAIPGCSIANHLHFPVVFVVSNGDVSVRGYFVVGFGNRGRNSMRMQVTASLSVNQPDDIAVTNKPKISGGVIVRFLSVGIDEPVVVGILVVVASDLLLLGTFGEGLHMRVQKASSIPHVLECDSRTNCKLKGAVPADLGATQVSLEKRAHLSIAGATVR